MNADELFSRLKDYGADVSGIDDRFMGDADLYKMCIADFLSDVNFDRLGSSVASADYKSAFEAAHALKGLSGNLGLTPFYEKICTLVEALRAKDYSDIGSQYGAVEAALKIVTEYFGDASAPDPPVPDPPPSGPPAPDEPDSWDEGEEAYRGAGQSWEQSEQDAPRDEADPPLPKDDPADDEDAGSALPDPSFAAPRRQADDHKAEPFHKRALSAAKRSFEEKGPNVTMIGAALIFVVLFVVFLFVNIINNYNKTSAAANADHLEEICFQLKLYVEENIDNNWKVANSIAASVCESRITSDRRAFLDFLSEQRDIWGVTDIIIYTESGYGVTSTGAANANDVVSQAIYDAKTNGEYLTILNSELIYTLPVETQAQFDGSRIAAVSVCHDVGTFMDKMGFTSFGGNAVIYLTQKNGAIISALTHRYAVNAYNMEAILTSMGVRGLNGEKVSSDYIFSREQAEVYLITAPEGVSYVVCMPVTVHHSGMMLFYVVPEALVNELSRSFSGFVTLLSAVLITIVLAGTMVIFVMVYNSSKRRFDEEMLSREHMYELLAQNTQTAFGFFRGGRPSPVYVSKNVESVIGRKTLLLDNEGGKLSMRGGEGEDGKDIQLINKSLRGWDGKGQFSSGYIQNGVCANRIYELQLFSVGDSSEEYVCIAQNSTTAYERENALRDALGMAESANRAKSRFLSNMSHDIRTPMNAIVNMTTFAIDSMDNPKKLREYLYTIRKSSDHLLNLINDVLTMSRIDSGKAALNEEPFDLVDLLNRLSDIVSPLCKSKNLIFINDFSKVSVKTIVGDHVKLSQILMNLLSNAVKYTPNNGAVRFTAVQLPSIREDMADLRFSVEDNGIGIPQRFMDKIFEPFTRVDSKRTSGIEGSGLGLSICHSYVVAMGGTLNCESEEGNGSTFTAEMFFKKTDAAAVKPLISAPKSVGEPYLGKRCLLCEDNATNLTIAKTMLERLGFLVDEATDGWEGLSLFKRSKPGQYDVIYMDIQMPVMDGYEAAVAIRESGHPQAQTVPIIAMTANVFAEDVEKARIAGMDGHIGKPIFTIDLVRETDRVINGLNARLAGRAEGEPDIRS